MSASVWPPIAPDELRKKEAESLARELQWLLTALQDTFANLKSGLEGCESLLAPEKGPATLVLSSHRSESVKGFITRHGTRIVKGDMNLRLHGVPPPKGSSSFKFAISTAPHAPTLALEQLTSARTLINTSLDIIDVSRWTGDAQNAGFIAGQLRLLCEHMHDAKQALKGDLPDATPWNETLLDPNVSSKTNIKLMQIFEPPLPHNLSLHLAITDGALVLTIRTLEPHLPGADPFSASAFRERVSHAFGGQKPAVHDETGQVYDYHGRQVVVREKIRLESQDPSLLSAMAKISALEHSAAMSRQALSTVMGVDD